jgi:hypothetical protein
MDYYEQINFTFPLLIQVKALTSIHKILILNHDALSNGEFVLSLWVVSHGNVSIFHSNVQLLGFKAEKDHILSNNGEIFLHHSKERQGLV